MTESKPLRAAYRRGLDAERLRLLATDEGRIGALILGEGDADDRAAAQARIAESPVVADLALSLSALSSAAAELSEGIAQQVVKRSAAASRLAIPTWLRRSGLALAAGLAAFALFGPAPQEAPTPGQDSDSGRIVSASFEGDAAQSDQVFRGDFDS